jgi:protein TonB
MTPKDFSAPQQTMASTEPHVAALSQAKSDKADYGWLTADMEKWYEEFNKFYPPELRLEGTTGRLKLRMLLGTDGVVSDVRIAESSGNARLDQAAIEIIRKAPPIKLSRQLGQASKPITFWYRFNLEPAR